jgi:UDP-glucose 4-epimerase
LKTLLTGAAGNLGSALLDQSGRAFVPFGRGDWPQLSEILSSDVDAVLHAAWDLTTAVAANPIGVLDDNVMSTMRLLDACSKHGVSKFAYVSTCAVYGASRDTAENSDCHPLTINGITKLLNERIIQDTCANFGIECQIYRVFNMYGGRDRFSILSHLARSLRDNVPFTLNNGGAAERDFVHVDDVARIIAQLLPMNLPWVQVNVGTGRANRIADIVAVVNQLRPELRIEHREVAEVEYSCADLTRLSSVLGAQHYVDVTQFVAQTFGPSTRSL